jgi:hypothetical protein
LPAPFFYAGALTLFLPHAKILLEVGMNTVLHKHVFPSGQRLTEYFQNQPDSQLGLVRLTLYDEPTLSAFFTEWQAMSWDV